MLSELELKENGASVDLPKKLAVDFAFGAQVHFSYDFFYFNYSVVLRGFALRRVATYEFPCL